MDIHRLKITTVRPSAGIDKVARPIKEHQLANCGEWLLRFRQSEMAPLDETRCLEYGPKMLDSTGGVVGVTKCYLLNGTRAELETVLFKGVFGYSSYNIRWLKRRISAINGVKLV
jgi:hypothetical protein